MPRVDVIVAVRNEEQNIPVFLEKLSALVLPKEVALAVLFIEDSSTDGTRPLLRRLARENPAVGYYTLTRGFGQGLATAFGLSRSTADAMIMMDVDGSHPVEVIPEMIRAYLEGTRVVQCVRRMLANRAAYRRIGAMAFQLVARSLTGVDTREQNIYYRLVTADVARSMLQPRYWHYLRFPLPRRPDGVLRKIHIETEERILGESKYHFRRLVNLAIDAVLSLMTKSRLAVVLLLAGIIGALSIWVGVWPLALAIGAAMGWLLRRWFILHRADTLQKMQVLESANVP
jgi:glycosyltransferase involved in cell wall biosynthesis